MKVRTMHAQSTLSRLPFASLGRRHPFRTLFDLFALGRQRRELSGLDESRLADLGLTRHEAMQEASRPIWDVPSSWHY
ncbi:DUF1127 domain-containing protein [Tropicimonas sp. IMCC34011]|uniref:DUF1127 domain-containing protein n=1 Tax=Tropicimonas sp. IMCC34011 TaxID=2248759 RepID=UPI001E48156F|nr:DUF1127 domain-containing protein [Tropicimonas sp. IMCC34011]